MQQTPPNSKRTFAWLRDHPGWGAASAVAAIIAVAVSVTHDIFGVSLDSKPNTPAPSSNPQAINSIPPINPSASPAPSNSKIPTPTKIGATPVGADENTPTIPKPSPKCAGKITIDTPRDGSKIKGEAGIKLIGSACGLKPGDTAWLFDFDPYDGYYYSADGPAVVKNGRWEYKNQPVGDPGDNNKFYILQMVLAADDCSDFIARFPVNDEGDKRLRRSDFPDSCTFVSAVDVSVTWPS